MKESREDQDQSREDQEQKERAALRLMEALSGADEELLERARGEAEKTGRMRAGKPLWQYGRAWAAVLCFLVVGAVSWGGLRLMTMRMGGSDNNSGNAYDAGQQSQTPEKGPELSEGEAGADAGENGAAPQEAPCGFEGFDQEKKREEDGYQGDGQDAEGQRGNDQDEGSQSGNIQNGAGQSGNSQSGTGKLENDQQEVSRGPEAAEDAIGELETAGCPAAPERQKLTEAQARESELGGYVPKVLPAGYVFEEASRKIGEEDSQTPSDLRLIWCRGMDSITLHITRDETQEISVVDVNAPETYDQRLYEIPLGESVPREYWESVSNPVFAAEDLSLEVIESRMVSGAGDSGDTDTPRGNFAVLYSDGVLVEFSGRGTAEEIWNMFEGLE
ncbi:MAG: hypothetical protein K2O06_16745 [Acetatifactor sp.]|nr:hypothetical protein [Acetatifactor sp.]